jgi:hypothetical protein
MIPKIKQKILNLYIVLKKSAGGCNEKKFREKEILYTGHGRYLLPGRPVAGRLIGIP